MYRKDYLHAGTAKNTLSSTISSGTRASKPAIYSHDMSSYIPKPGYTQQQPLAKPYGEKIKEVPAYYKGLEQDYNKKYSPEKPLSASGYSHKSNDKEEFVTTLKEILKDLQISAKPGASQITGKLVELANSLLGEITRTVLTDPRDLHTAKAKEDLKKKTEGLLKGIEEMEPNIVKMVIEEVKKKKYEPEHVSLPSFYKKAASDLAELFKADVDSIVKETKQENDKLKYELEKAKKDVANYLSLYKQEQGKLKKVTDELARLQEEKKKWVKHNPEIEKKNLRDKYQSIFKTAFSTTFNSMKRLQDRIVSASQKQNARILEQANKLGYLKEVLKKNKVWSKTIINGLNKQVESLNKTISELQATKPAISPLKKDDHYLKTKHGALQEKVQNMKAQLTKSLTEIQHLRLALKDVGEDILLYNEQAKEITMHILKDFARPALPKEESQQRLAEFLQIINPKLKIFLSHNPPLDKLITLTLAEYDKLKELNKSIEEKVEQSHVMELSHKTALNSALKHNTKLREEHKIQIEGLLKTIDELKIKQNPGSVTPKEAEQLIEELIIRNVKLEDKLDALTAETSSKEKTIMAMIKENRTLAENVRDTQNVLYTTYKSLHGKAPRTKVAIDIIRSIHEKVEEVLKDKPGILSAESPHEKSVLESKLELASKELENAKEDAKAAEDLLIKVCELSEKIEALEQSKVIWERNEAKLLKENKEYKETVQECMQLVLECIGLTKASPEKTRKLVNLCAQLKQIVESITRS